MKSHEFCDYCWKLKYKLNFEIWKLCIDKDKFELFYIPKTLGDFLDSLSNNSFFIPEYDRHYVEKKLDNPKYSSIIPEIVGTCHFTAVRQSTVMLLQCRLSMKIYIATH